LQFKILTIILIIGVVSSNDEMRKRIRKLVVTNLKRFGVGTPLQESLIQKEVHEMLSIFDRQQGQAFNPKRIIATTLHQNWVMLFKTLCYVHVDLNYAMPLNTTF
jgi:hypothetical protein